MGYIAFARSFYGKKIIRIRDVDQDVTVGATGSGYTDWYRYPASFLILPKIVGLITIMPLLVVFSTVSGIVGAYATAYIGHIITPSDLTAGLQHMFEPWFFWMGVVKSLFFAFIIASVSSFYGYTVEGGSIEVGKASTNAVVSCSMLILFSDLFLTQLLS